jgi:Cysteine rich repeat
MTTLNRPAAIAVCVLAPATVAVMEPALAKDPEPYNAADAARKYCSRAYKRYCANVAAQGLQALDCLKEHVKRLPPACRKAVLALRAARCEGF